MQRRSGHHGQASQRRLAGACALYQLARNVLAAFMVAAMRMRPEGVIERNFHVGQGPIIQLRHNVVSFKDAGCRNLTVSGCRNLNFFGAAVENVEFRMEPVGGNPALAISSGASEVTV
jgi:hypothetical protein